VCACLEALQRGRDGNPAARPCLETALQAKPSAVDFLQKGMRTCGNKNQQAVQARQVRTS
jgi:hypothetical protein